MDANETKLPPVSPEAAPEEPVGKRFPYDKGRKGGACNRAACLARPATCWNLATEAYYCVPCARKINEHNPGLCEVRRSTAPAGRQPGA